jgi:hypothetical protein
VTEFFVNGALADHLPDAKKQRSLLVGDRNLWIRDLEQSFLSDQPEPPQWNSETTKQERTSIALDYLVPEGYDDITERENDGVAFELILSNSLSDFRYSGKV